MKSVSPTSLLGRAAVFGLVAGFILAIILPDAVNYMRRPAQSLDKNTEAYWYILEGMKCGNYTKAKEMFDWAYSSSDDPQIRYVANFNSKGCQLILNAGVENFEQASSISGSVKEVVRGFFSPMDGIEAWGQLFQKWFGDYDMDCEIIDARYHPRYVSFLAQWAVWKNASQFYWSVFLATPVVFVLFSKSRLKTDAYENRRITSVLKVDSVAQANYEETVIDAQVVISCPQCEQKLSFTVQKGRTRLKCGKCGREFYYPA